MPTFDDLVSSLRATAAALDASSLSGDEAAHLVEVISEGERLCQAVRTVAAARVLQTAAWRERGSYRTAAMWMAARTHGTLSHAIGAVQTASRLADLPATRAALVAGELSDVQAAEICAAAAVDPSAEIDLLRSASSCSVRELKERCSEVISAALSDEERCERIRRGRYLRRWTDRDGAFRLDGRLTPDDGAVVWSVISARADRLQTKARLSGLRVRSNAGNYIGPEVSYRPVRVAPCGASRPCPQTPRALGAPSNLRDRLGFLVVTTADVRLWVTYPSGSLPTGPAS